MSKGTIERTNGNFSSTALSITITGSSNSSNGDPPPHFGSTDSPSYSRSRNDPMSQLNGGILFTRSRSKSPRSNPTGEPTRSHNPYSGRGSSPISSSSEYKRHCQDPSRDHGYINHYGRHSNQWLFGDFSVRDSIEKLLHPENKPE